MKLKDLEVIITRNPNPDRGGQYFIFVKLVTKCRIVGYGEVYAATISPQTMKIVIEDVFFRHMYNQDPSNIELMFRKIYSSGYSQRPDPTVVGAFSGLEIACWDIIGKSLNLPVWKLLGGRVRNKLRTYTYLYPNSNQKSEIFYRSATQSAAAALKLVEKGFTAIKFDPAGAYTIFDGHQPSIADLERSEDFCHKIRANVGENADILFGTHGQFTPSGAIRLATKIEKYSPLWFEEPIPPDSPENMSLVAKATKIPIATGERLTTKYEFAQILRSGAASILQPALGRVGGIWEAKKIAAIAEVFGAQIAPHLYAGPIEWAANIQLSMTLPNFLILETIGTGEEFQEGLVNKKISWKEGYLCPLEAPGLGIELNEEFARKNPYLGEKLHLEMSEKETNQS